MNRTVITVFVTGMLLLDSGGPAIACLSCATEVELTEADAACLSSRIDDLIAEAEETDPLLVVLDCEMSAATDAGEGDRGSAATADPSIPADPPINGEQPPPSLAPSYFIASRIQLACLKDKLVGTPAYPMTVDFQGCGDDG
jgi:hypothetical protein